jgi:hypothetical protein
MIPTIGLESYDVNLETQTVTVHPNGATYEEVLAKITKTGKEVSVHGELAQAALRLPSEYR